MTTARGTPGLENIMWEPFVRSKNHRPLKIQMRVRRLTGVSLSVLRGFDIYNKRLMGRLRAPLFSMSVGNCCGSWSVKPQSLST